MHYICKSIYYVCYFNKNSVMKLYISKTVILEVGQHLGIGTQFTGNY